MAFTRFLRRVFGIYPGEGIRTWQFGSISVIWGFGSSLAETLTTGLFLQNVGTLYLPHVYMATSIGMLLTACLFIYFLRMIPASKILIYTLKFSLIFIFLVIVGVAISPHFKAFWIALSILTQIYVAFLIASFWSFVDQYHDLQEAKRSYSLYNSCYFLGVILAGGSINLLINTLGPAPLFGIVLATMALSLYRVYNIVTNISPLEEDTLDIALASGKKSFATFFHEFRTSQFTIVLVFTSIVIQLLVTCTDYNSREMIGRNFSPAMGAGVSTNENYISELLGKIKAGIALWNIIFGLFLYRKTLRRIGITRMLLLPPLFFFLIYSNWIFFDKLMFAVVGLVAIEGLIYSVEDSNFNLLVAVAPLKLKGMLRIINDSFFEPIGMLFSSLLLFLFPDSSKLLGLVLSILFLMAILSLRKHFGKSLSNHLRYNAIHFERFPSDWIEAVGRAERKEIKDNILYHLEKGSERDRLLLYRYLLKEDSCVFLKEMVDLSDRFSEEGKVLLLRLFDQSYHSSHPMILALVQKWSENFVEPLTKKWASIYLAKKGLGTSANLLSDASDNIEELELYLLGETPTTYSFEKALNSLTHPSFSIRQLSSRMLAKLSSRKFSHFAHALIDHLRILSDAQIRLHLLESLGKMQDVSTIKELILASLHLRPAEKRKTEILISQIGEEAIDPLLSLIQDEKIHHRCRILAGKILAKISLPHLRSHLKNIIPKEIERAYFYYYYGNTIQTQYPSYNLTLLKNTLLTSYEAVIDFVLHLLGAAGSIEDCDLLVHTLHTQYIKAHAHAVEMIENNCDRHLFLKILPLIDDIPMQAKLDAFVTLYKKRANLTLFELLTHLEQSSLLFDKTVSAHLKAKLQLPNWQESVKKYMQTSEGPFLHFAHELLNYEAP